MKKKKIMSTLVFRGKINRKETPILKNEDAHPSEKQDRQSVGNVSMEYEIDGHPKKRKIRKRPFFSSKFLAPLFPRIHVYMPLIIHNRNA